jgi:EAL domain-containing protein (putative c-di-GMP-specific phosphodiesterase class I)
MIVNIVDVRRALESDAIVPCFEPVVEARSGRLVGFEVLARWNHPDHGVILPENFIALAEKNGLIGHLTQRILRQSFLAATADKIRTPNSGPRNAK